MPNDEPIGILLAEDNPGDARLVEVLLSDADLSGSFDILHAATLRMPRMDGLAATRAIKQEHPGTSVLMITMHDDPDYLFEALRAGAAGYVLRTQPGKSCCQLSDGCSPASPPGTRSRRPAAPATGKRDAGASRYIP